MLVEYTSYAHFKFYLTYAKKQLNAGVKNRVMSFIENGIHIISGQAAAGSFKQAFQMHDRLIIHDDILSCGPTPYCHEYPQWKDTRINYLKTLFNNWPDAQFRLHDMCLYKNIHRLSSTDSIYIWASTGLEDQLLIPFLIYLLDLVDAQPEQIHLIQFESLPDRDFLITSMGQLSPEQMRAHPEPVKLSEMQIKQYQSVWSALTSDNPLRLGSLLTMQPALNKYSHQALNYVLRRYPRAESGLGFWDKLLLNNTQKHGPTAAKIIAYSLGIDGDHVGDLYLLSKLRGLANHTLAKPLVYLSGEQTSIRDTQATLTEFGIAVLNGKSSAYPTNAIDEWIGGVHLSSETGNLWFIKNGQLIEESKL